jgi:hypothetical protein
MFLLQFVEGLDEHLTWSDDNRRCELAAVFPGILSGCIGVGDAKEYEIKKPKDSVKENVYLKENSFLIISGYHWIVHSKGMVDPFAHKRTQEMIWIRFITT